MFGLKRVFSFCFRRRTEQTCNPNVDLLVTQAGVEKYYASLDTTKSRGLDGIHPRVLRECAGSFAIPLCLIFRQSLKEGEVPDLWRRANVTALFKKGSKLQPSNYRPVSLTSVPCKALESLVREAIMDHCERAGFISKKQHGFVFKRACVTNLLESLDIMTSMPRRADNLVFFLCSLIICLNYYFSLILLPSIVPGKSLYFIYVIKPL